MTKFLDETQSLISLNHINLIPLFILARQSATLHHRIFFFKDNTSVRIKGTCNASCWLIHMER